MWSFVLHDSLSGAPLLDVFPSGGSWRRSCTDPGSGSHDFQLRDVVTALPAEVWRSESRPWARTLVVLWDGVPVYAGLITGRKYKRGTGVLTLRHHELKQLLKRRFQFAFEEFNPASPLTVTDRSHRGMIRALVRAGMYRDAAPFWTMPVDYPADEAGVLSRTWWHYQAKTIAEMIGEIERTEFAPEWDFRPKYVDGWLRWDLVIGTPRLPGVLFEVPDAPDTPGVDIEWDEDALEQATGGLVLGEGSEADVKWAIQGNRDAPDKPWLDRMWPEKSVSDPTHLQRLATGWMDQFERIKGAYSVNVVAGEGVPFADMQPGARIRFHSHDDPFLVNGEKDLYTLAVGGDMTSVLKPEVVAL